MSKPDLKIDKLIQAINEKANPTCLGLDTRLSFLPEAFAKNYATPVDAVRAFNFALLDALKDIIPCIKIQAACYELLGLPGIACLTETIAEAQRLGYITILDAKRGDIGISAALYSGAYLAKNAPMPADFLTVNPYLGSDGIVPFVNDCAETGRGIFVLVKTSNASSGEFQDVMIQCPGCESDTKPLFVHVGEKVSAWGADLIGENNYSAVCAVVGATYPEQGAMLRRILPHTFFLLPGYGAQGATASDLAGCFDAKGRGAIVNASRSLIAAHKKVGTDDFVAASHDEALRMRDALRAALKL